MHRFYLDLFFLVFLSSFPTLPLFKWCFAFSSMKLSTPPSKWEFFPDIKYIIIKHIFSSNEPFPLLINLYIYDTYMYMDLGSYYVLYCDLTFLSQKNGVLNEELVKTEQCLISISINFLSKTRFPGRMGRQNCCDYFFIKIHILP